MSRVLKACVAAFVAVLVVACGGGGGGNAGTSVIGGGSSGTATAADLSLVLTGGTNNSGSSVSNGGTSTITATATAVDASRNALAGIPVTISVDSSAVVTPSGTQTNSSGVVTGQIGIGADKSNRVVTVTATSGSLTRTASFAVTGASLTATLVPNIPTPGSTGNQIQYRLVDANSNAMVGQTITVTSSSLPTTTGTTDGSGAYTLTYTAPATAGSMDVTATAAGTSFPLTVQVQASSGAVPAVTTPVLSPSVSATPSVVGVNATGTANRAEVRALFLGASNAGIQNIRVRFDLAGDANSIGGTFSTGSNVVYSNANGVASSAYVPGTRSSPTNGVTIRACWDYSDFSASACPNQAVTQLTVADDALRVSIGTDELVGVPSSGTYTKDYTIVVVDSAGRAKADVQITPALDLLGFYKGSYAWNGTAWVQTVINTGFPYVWDATNGWVRQSSGQFVCPNEDANRNGVLETSTNSSSEDINANGVLDPSGVSIVTVSTGGKTDSSGKAVVRIEYPRDRASWIDYKITITAAVAGTEGKAIYIGTRLGQGALPYPGSAVTNQTITPAFAISPYGRGLTASCLTAD